jgi:hypothetical protein
MIQYLLDAVDYLAVQFRTHHFFVDVLEKPSLAPPYRVGEQPLQMFQTCVWVVGVVLWMKYI